MELLAALVTLHPHHHLKEIMVEQVVGLVTVQVVEVVRVRLEA
jgi:hypothetical protein